MIYIAIGVLLAVASQSNADTLNVGQGEAYSTIQAAIDDANNGDTISVAAGVYYEQIDIDKALTIQGAGVHVTIIDGTGLDRSILGKSPIIMNQSYQILQQDYNDLSGLYDQLNQEYS